MRVRSRSLGKHATPAVENLVRERDALSELLRKVEWASGCDDCGTGGNCPMCGEHKDHGHMADCKLGRWLRWGLLS